jgi:hypothetical protein
MRRYRAGWQSYKFELEDIAEVARGKVVGICREQGVDEHGVPVDRRFGGLWVVQRAKIASWSTYLTPKEAVRAARELAGGEPPPRKPKPVPRRKPAPQQPQQGAPQPGGGPTEEQRRAAKARARLQRQKAAS